MSKQCPNCGDVYTKDMWLMRKGRYGHYFCPNCETKLHWDDLINFSR